MNEIFPIIFFLPLWGNYVFNKMNLSALFFPQYQKRNFSYQVKILIFTVTDLQGNYSPCHVFCHSKDLWTLSFPITCNNMEW